MRELFSLEQTEGVPENPLDLDIRDRTVLKQSKSHTIALSVAEGALEHPALNQTKFIHGEHAE